MFQFASLLNGSDKIDEPESVRSVPVVDYNSLELWQFKSYGEVISEDVPTLGLSKIRHYSLIARENDPYKRQIDFWLAKDLDWLPGRIRSKEANGRVLELIFKQKSPAPSQAGDLWSIPYFFLVDLSKAETDLSAVSAVLFKFVCAILIACVTAFWLVS